MMLTAALCAPPTVSVAEGSVRAMGFLPSPKGGIAARRVAATKTPALLRASAKSALPAQWDSRAQGWVSPVKNQGSVGTCWAFASYATLETQMLKAGSGEWDFSEKNMVNMHGWDMAPNDGGDYIVAAGYLLRWGGAVAETNDVYVRTLASWTPSPPLMPAVRVQHVVWTDPLDGTQERMNELKAAIMEYGAVATSLYWDSSRVSDAYGTLYGPYGQSHDHAVTFIGWDDGFPTNRFKVAPPGAGAWIIKNSWGRNNANEGFYYVSYHDATIGRLYSGAVFIPAGDGEDYDAVHGHDRLGCAYDVSQSYWFHAAVQYDLQAAVFTATWREQLAAVGVWTSVYPNPYEISIYTNVTRGAGSPIDNGVLACRQTGTLEHAGFATIPLDAPLELADGTSFSVVYRQTGTARSTCVNCTVTGLCSPVHARGNSFFGFSPESGDIETADWRDGVDEAVNVDVTDISWAACIKAYTRATSAASVDDAPGGSDDGTAYLADLAQTNATLFADTGETFGASARLVGTNGRSLWSSWLTGLDPSDPSDREFAASITFTNGVPCLGWTPDLGDRRTYTVWGRDSLGAGDAWRPVDKDDLGATSARFFKVSVSQ